MSTHEISSICYFDLRRSHLSIHEPIARHLVCPSVLSWNRVLWWFGTAIKQCWSKLQLLKKFKNTKILKSLLCRRLASNFEIAEELCDNCPTEISSYATSLILHKPFYLWTLKAHLNHVVVSYRIPYTYQPKLAKSLVAFWRTTSYLTSEFTTCRLLSTS